MNELMMIANNGSFENLDVNTMTVNGKLSNNDAKMIIEGVKDFNEKSSTMQGCVLSLLLEAYDLEALKELGYKNQNDLGKKLFGLSAGVTSERINVFNRFRDKSGAFALDPAFSGFKYSGLVKMKDLSDEEIAGLGLTFESRAIDIATKVKELQDKKDEEKKQEENSGEENSGEENTGEENKTETTSESSDSEQNEDVSRETVEINFSELNASLQQALSKYLKANMKEVYEARPILAIDLSK